MKNFGVVIGVFLSTGCVVADMDSSNYTSVRYVQTFQKTDQVGRTDIVKRKSDLYSCGVSQSQNLDDNSWSRGGAKSDETFEQHVLRVKKVETCMKQKGYIVFGFDQCGPLKAPTGLCN